MIRNLLARAWTRGLTRVLELAHEHLPVRAIRNCAGGDYLERVYLVGYKDEGFPAKTVLGWLPWAVYLDRIETPDLEPEHHSHPWRRAWSLVLLNGYVEEVLREDGTVELRHRWPWTLARLTDETFHRIASLLNGPTWTLFVVTRRSGSWYFRLADGWLVEGREFIRKRTAERRAARSGGWFQVAPGAKVEPGEFVALDGDELIVPGASLRVLVPAAPSRTICASCVRVKADDADYDHASRCASELCTYGINLCWGGRNCDDARRKLQDDLTAQWAKYKEDV